MAIDLKHEFTRPLVLILGAFAALGWVLFFLASWSWGSVHKAQRLQIMEVTEKNEKLSTELSRHMAAVKDLAELERQVAATRDEMARMAQAKSDVQSELTGAQRNLASVRRDLSEADRSLQAQNQRLNDFDAAAAEAAPATPDTTAGVVPRAAVAARPVVGWGRRGRTYRSFSVITRRR